MFSPKIHCPPLLRTVGVARWRDSRGGEGGIWRRSMNHFSPFFLEGEGQERRNGIYHCSLYSNGQGSRSSPFLLLRGANPHPSSPPPKKRNWEEKRKSLLTMPGKEALKDLSLLRPFLPQYLSYREFSPFSLRRRFRIQDRGGEKK